MIIQFDDDNVRPASRALLAEALMRCVIRDAHPERFGIYDLARQIDYHTTTMLAATGRPGPWPLDVRERLIPETTDDI